MSKIKVLDEKFLQREDLLKWEDYVNTKFSFIKVLVSEGDYNYTLSLIPRIKCGSWIKSTYFSLKSAITDGNRIIKLIKDLGVNSESELNRLAKRFGLAKVS